jgi:3-oxoacyl-[acyl-carrier-protein] synthase II
MSARDVIITGIGIVTSLGEGIDAQVKALTRAKPLRDSQTFEPYTIHPSVAVNLDLQIPKKSDQRQMEQWQRMGTYAAGAALEDAGIKGNADLLAKMNLIVACGGGERDYETDGSILTGLRTAEKPEVYLNERLMSDIRPTLFLAQLSNLLAGNISIVHGVIGGSRTFMGEEQSSVDAIRIAEARIRSGQNDIFMVGSAVNAERADLIVNYEMGGAIWRDADVPVLKRGGGGFVPGSASVFLILETRAHAEARGAKIYARLNPIQADQSRRKPGDVQRSLTALLEKTGAAETIISGNTGFGAASVEEVQAIKAVYPKAKQKLSGDMIGHAVEAQFAFGVALAAGGIAAGKLNGPTIVTSVGHHRGEGAVKVEAA